VIWKPYTTAPEFDTQTLRTSWLPKQFMLRTGVIGVGHLGRQHARIHASLAAEGFAEFVAVCDLDSETGRAVSTERKTIYTSDWRELIGLVDAVSIAVPTQSHCEIACGLLEHGIHDLVEKPISRTL
jgi:predicted dehydrogenase